MQSGEAQVFDKIHDTQAVYRKLLDALAWPGQVQSIADITSRMSMSVSFSPTLLACALMLLDQEVTFAVVSPEAFAISEFIRWQTLSRETDPGAADYVFVDTDLSAFDIAQLMQNFKRGTLLEPHTSATVFVSVADIAADQGTSRGHSLESEGDTVVLELTGPGVKDSATCTIQRLPSTWLEQRSRINAEYPLGIDMVFATENGVMMGVPRTTGIRHETVTQGVS